MKTILQLKCFFLCISFFGCVFAQQLPLVDEPCDDGSKARLYVSGEGVIFLNNTKVAMEKLPGIFESKKFKEVCYSRENPENPDPHPNAIYALDQVAKVGLSISFYWDKGFTKKVSFTQ